METKKGRITTIQDLGDDLMVKIISWLPLKSIVLCLGVCKQWQSLISDSPFFLTNTINVAHRHYDDTFICHRRCQRGGGIQDSELPFSIKSLDKSLFAQVYDGGILAGPPIYDYGIFATCNGLLIYGVFIRSTKELRECYISNPWTRECVPFEKPSYPRPIAGWGLAFENNPINSNSRNSNSSSSNNAALYEIVVVHYKFENQTYLFEVCSSDKKRWQLIQSAIKFCYPRLNNNAVYCRRVLYWQCCEKQALIFNLETETPDYLELPRDTDNDHAMAHRFHKSKLVECHGQLHCLQTSSGGSRLSIWKMSTTMSHGWLLLHNVDLGGVVERNLDVLDPEHKTKNNLLLAFSPIDMN